MAKKKARIKDESNSIDAIAEDVARVRGESSLIRSLVNDVRMLAIDTKSDVHGIWSVFGWVVVLQILQLITLFVIAVAVAS